MVRVRRAAAACAAIISLARGYYCITLPHMAARRHRWRKQPGNDSGIRVFVPEGEDQPSERMPPANWDALVAAARLTLFRLGRLDSMVQPPAGRTGAARVGDR